MGGSEPSEAYAFSAQASKEILLSYYHTGIRELFEQKVLGIGR
jgi:hypothetical protein